MAQQDYGKMMQDMMGQFPFDTASVQDAFRSYAQFGEKMSKVVLEAAGASNEIQSKWAKDTLSNMGQITIVKGEPTDYTKTMTDFASAQAEGTAETLAAYAEVAKKVQMESVELMLAAGKDAQEDASSAMKKASTNAQNAQRAAK